jgi:hypothetical protein
MKRDLERAKRRIERTGKIADEIILRAHTQSLEIYRRARNEIQALIDRATDDATKLIRAQKASEETQ